MVLAPIKKNFSLYHCACVFRVLHIQLLMIYVNKKKEISLVILWIHDVQQRAPY